jgi:hypothetical protein
MRGKGAHKRSKRAKKAVKTVTLPSWLEEQADLYAETVIEVDDVARGDRDRVREIAKKEFLTEAYLHSLTPSSELLKAAGKGRKRNPSTPRSEAAFIVYSNDMLGGPGGWIGSRSESKEQAMLLSRRFKGAVMALAHLYLGLESKMRVSQIEEPDVIRRPSAFEIEKGVKAGSTRLLQVVKNQYHRLFIVTALIEAISGVFAIKRSEIEQEVDAYVDALTDDELFDKTKRIQFVEGTRALVKGAVTRPLPANRNPSLRSNPGTPKTIRDAMRSGTPGVKDFMAQKFGASMLESPECEPVLKALWQRIFR